jgi:hypothetical protein
MTTYGPITTDDAVIVHRHLVFHDGNGRWSALGDDDLMSAADADALLGKIAKAVGSGDGIETLRARLAQAIETSARQRREDELYKTRTGRR